MRKSKKLLALVMVFAMLVTMLPTAAFAAQEPICGIEAHTHGAECYTQETICTEAESEGHTHGDGCYTVTEGTSELTCASTEEGHEHDDGCYTVTEGTTELACGVEPSEGHTHSDACVKKTLTCEVAEHTHTDACYAAAEEPTPPTEGEGMANDMLGANGPVEDIEVGEYHLMDRGAFYNYCLNKIQTNLGSGHKAESLATTFTQIVATDGRTTNSLVGLQLLNIYIIEERVGGKLFQPEDVKEIVFKGTYVDRWANSWLDWGLIVRDFEVTMPIELFTITSYDSQGDTEAYAEIVFAAEPETPEVSEVFVTFDNNLPGRAETPEQPYAIASVASGAVLSTPAIPADPKFDGYTFDGWYLNGNEFNFATPITEDITLVAKWTENVVQGQMIALTVNHKLGNNKGFGTIYETKTEDVELPMPVDVLALAKQYKKGTAEDGYSIYKDGYQHLYKNATAVEGENNAWTLNLNYCRLNFYVTTNKVPAGQDSPANWSGAIPGTVTGLTLDDKDHWDPGDDGRKQYAGHYNKIDTDVSHVYPVVVTDAALKRTLGNSYNAETQKVLWYTVHEGDFVHVDGIVVNKTTPTVVYHANYGGGGTQTYDADKKVQGDLLYSHTVKSYEATDLKDRQGYKFLGWAYTANAKAPAADLEAGSAIEVAGNTDLYAVWQAPDTNVTVWHYYGDDILVQGETVPGQKRDSQLITADWVNGKNSMDHYTGAAENEDCFDYKYFEIYAVTDDGAESQKVEINTTTGYLDLTNFKSVNVHLVYDEVKAPIVYHSNFGNDATWRVLADRGEDKTFAHAVLTYPATQLPARADYTFLGWAYEQSATIASPDLKAGNDINVTKGTDLYAVWKANDAPVQQDTVVAVAHYYGGTGVTPVAGNAVEDQVRASTMITGEWVNGLQSKEFYVGANGDLYVYSGFEIYTIADGEDGYSETPITVLDGHLDLTNTSTVSVRLIYNQVKAPIVYHSNFGTDATYRVLADKVDNTYADYSVLSYAGTALAGRSNYSFLGWSTTAGGGADIRVGSAQTITDAGLELFAVWQYNGGGTTDNDDDDDDDNTGGGNTGGNTGDNTNTDAPEEEIIVDEDVPLANAPVDENPPALLPELGEDFVIMDEQVPLGNLPQTGSKSSAQGALGFMAFSFTMAAAGLMALGRKKETQD